MEFSLQQWTEYLAFADFALLIVLVIIGLTLVGTFSISNKMFLSYLIVMLVIECLAKYQAYILKQNNIYLLHFYLFFEFLTLSMYLRETLTLSSRRKRQMTLFIILVQILLFFYSFNILVWHQENLTPEHFQLYPNIFTNLFIIFFSALYFIQFVSNPNRAYIHRVSFVLVGGLLFYYSGSFVIFMAINKLIDTRLNETFILWMINALLTFVFYLIVLRAFIIHRKYWKKVQFG